MGDRLTFVGPADQRAVIRFIDCREGSPTLHREITHEFRPSPLRYLVVPAGVAHAWWRWAVRTTGSASPRA
ncbi:hypothetical protein [Sphaerisporangium aureirubrum]|uniref:Uncharacterized protein n=1 Tax=Sphaerisporangium aureirubrum TaxID=1544736 RepID=A0ABW1NFM8_9ACTN